MTTIDSATERAARVFLERVAGRFDVVQAILFGSRARGDHRADSDADIAVVLGGRPGEFFGTQQEHPLLTGMNQDALCAVLPAPSLWMGAGMSASSGFMRVLSTLSGLMRSAFLVAKAF